MQILTVAAAAGAIQGFLILLSIICRCRHRKNLPLALLLIVFSLRLATIPTWQEEVLLAYPWIYPLTAPLPFLFAPLLWWYIREFAGETLKRAGFIFVLFLPYFFEFLAVAFTVISMNSEEYEIFLKNVFSGSPPLWLTVRNSLKVALNIIFMVFSGMIAFGRKSETLSGAKKLWLRSLVVAPSVVLSFFAYVALDPAATMRLSGGNALPFAILSVTMLAFIYVISFLFMISPEFSLLEYIRPNDTHEQLCTDIECRYLVEKVEKKLDDGAFKNPDLTLSDLASELGVHPNRLSYAINHCCKLSFRAVLNRKRLVYFCRMVSSGSLETKSILDLAFEAGFPSKSTFNRVFREKTGMSPSEYLKKTDIA